MIDPGAGAAIVVAAPALAGAAIVAGGVSPRRAAAGAAGASALSMVCAVWLLRQRPEAVSTLWSWAPELSLDVSWRLETAPLALAILVAGIGLLVLQYAGRYFAAEPGAGTTIALLAAFESSMLGLVLADNLLLLYVFWELTGICSFFLIGSDRSKGEAGPRAANQALLVTVAGGLSMLVGILYLIARAGSASLTALLAADLDAMTQTVALALILPAVLTKSAQVPTHFWLPGAMAAPTPVSAYLHSATMVKAGLVLLLYLHPMLGDSPLWTSVLLPAGAATCVWGSLQALRESDVKLLMAWSTVSQLGLITLTIGLGTDVAIRAAILHLFAHAIFKAGLFLTVGGVDHAAGTRSLLELGGLWRRTPVLAAAAALLAGSMAGIPPLAGFLSKELILKKAMLAELWVHAVAISGIVLGAVGTVAYSSRFFFETFTGEARSDRARRARPVPAGMLLAPVALAAVTCVAGPAASWVDRWFLEPVAFSIVGSPLEVKPLSLWYGINATLLLSLVIVATGYRVDRWLGLRFLGERVVRAWHGAELFDRSLDGARWFGRTAVRALAGASPQVYLGIAIACGVLPGLALVPALAEIGWSSLLPAGGVVVAVILLLLVFLLTTGRRLARVLILTAIGLSVAMLFRLANGPDLMLTQLLVEVLVTIFFALALWAAPSPPDRSAADRRPAWRGPRVALGVIAGLTAAAWVAALSTATHAEHVAGFVREVAPEIAKGDNLVNVVLTDVRSLDTLIETLVVVLGSLGVVALLRGDERGDVVARRRAESGVDGPRTSGLLPGLARAIVPIGVLFSLVMLVKGHNDPGGGFVAGLGLGGTAMIWLAASGPLRFARSLPISPSAVAILGCGLMLASGVVGWLTGRPFLTHLHGTLTIGGRDLALHTTLIFDLGVMLAVAGGVSAAGFALWRAAAGAREVRR